jgi:replication initiation and membrane attachment protein DnaB
LPKNRKIEVDNIQEVLKKGLSNDNSLNIAALTNLLREMIKNE